MQSQDRYRALAAEVRALAGRLGDGAETDPVVALAEAGFLGLTLPPAFGGGGQDYRALATLCEELGRIDIAHQITVTVHLALVGMSILQWGTDAQRRSWLPRLARGERIATFALTEPGAGSDVGALRATARRDGDGYVLNGEKAWISLSDVADLILVFATVDPALRHRGITAFLVERGAPGLSTTTYHGKLGIRAGNTGSVVLQDVRVGCDAVLGREGEGFAVALNALGNGLFTVGAGALGAGQAAIDAIRRRLSASDMADAASSQWVQEKVAGMVSRIEQARLLLDRAGDLKNRGAPNAQATGLAKWQAAEAAFAACDEALAICEVFGGPPFDELEQRLWNVKGSVIYGGTREIHTGMQASYVLGGRREREPRCPAPTARDLAGGVATDESSA